LNEQHSDPMAEAKAMQAIAEAVAGLDPDAIGRIAQWMIGVFRVAIAGGTRVNPPAVVIAAAETDHYSNNGNLPVPFSSLAELYAAANPENEADTALIAGYWTQFCEGKTEFTSLEINAALKELGYKIKNITGAFDVLKSRKPSHVMQLKKSGNTRQARKSYRLTLGGKTAVETMLNLVQS
jgi:hypothetical protein